MAVLTVEQIQAKLDKPDERIKNAKTEHSKYMMHVHGIDVTSYVVQMEGLENDRKIALRKRIARSNKDLFADILRPTDKVFHSKGGSKTYELSKGNQEKFQTLLSKTKEGISLPKWIENIWMDKYVTDPNGVILIEHKDGKAYPTYKSIDGIRDYETTGVNLEYIIFEPFKDTNGMDFVRVYDDEGDKTFQISNTNILIPVPEFTFDNPFGVVPGVTCSNLIDPISFFKKSPIYEQIELADEYLRENSVKTLFKYHHGFPFFWMYMSACPICKGTTQVNGEECKACHGTGLNTKKDVSDITYVKPPEDKEQPLVAPNLAGYVVPPIESWKQMTDELKLMRDMIYHSHWGVLINRDVVEKTAFEVAMNTQPMQDRLNQYADSAEIIEGKLTDFLGAFYFGSAYKGSQINYGRNFIIMSPNELMKEYLDDKIKGLGETTLNDKLKKYYNSLYKNDNFKLVIFTKLIHIEPFPHNTIKEVKDLRVPVLDYMMKIYYNDWLNEVTEDEIFATDTKVLKDKLKDFTLTKIKDYETHQVPGMESGSGLERQNQSETNQGTEDTSSVNT